MVEISFNARTLEAETGESLRSRLPCTIPGHPELYQEILFPIPPKKENKKKIPNNS